MGYWEWLQRKGRDAIVHYKMRFIYTLFFIFGIPVVVFILSANALIALVVFCITAVFGITYLMYILDRLTSKSGKNNGDDVV